jgi:hypothetical protein
MGGGGTFAPRHRSLIVVIFTARTASGVDILVPGSPDGTSSPCTESICPLHPVCCGIFCTFQVVGYMCQQNKNVASP